MQENGTPAKVLLKRWLLAICEGLFCALFLHTFAAIGAAVADEAAGAIVTLRAVMGRIEVFCGNGAFVEVGETEVNRSAFVVHAGFVCHFALQAFAW